MILVEDLNLELPGFSLKDINLRIRSGDYFILVGPTGSGKTVLLETIAGLHTATSGRIWIDGCDVTSLEPEKRGIGMVYQDCALFPHLTVQENIAFGLRVQRKHAAQIRRELDRVVGLFGIEHLLARRPESLSGGEKQKVALARTTVTNPRVLLLDEPLRALDLQTREDVRQEIVKLHARLGITTINVTHDFEEAISMGTRVAVIGDGSIRQVGSPEEVFRNPNSEFVARFTMAVNIFAGVARREADGTTFFATEGIGFRSYTDMTGSCCAAIRPENILVSRTRTDGDCANVLPAVVTRIVDKGSTLSVTADLPPALSCLLTRPMFQEMGLIAGQRVYLTIPPSAVSLFRE